MHPDPASDPTGARPRSEAPDGGEADERLRLEQEPRASEAMYRELLERQGEGFGVVDAEERFLLANPVAETIFGVPPGGLPGRSLMEFLDEPGRKKVQSETLDRQSGLASTYELDIRRPNGERRTILVTATPRATRPGQGLQVIGVFRDITDDRMATLEREQYFKLFNAASDIMVMADPLGCFKHVNPAAMRILGYSEGELMAKPFLEFIHPEDRQRTADEMARQMKVGLSRNFENRYLCKDGSHRWLSWQAVYVEAERTTYATARDVTDLKQADRALQESEKKFQKLLEAASVPIGVAGALGEIEYLNPRFLQDLAYTREELPDLETWWQRAYPDPEYRRQAMGAWQEAQGRAAACGGNVVMDQVFRITCGNGQVRLVEIHAAMAGPRAIVFMQDLTERVKAEEALRDALELSERMITSQPLGVIAFHASSGRCIRANEAIARMVGGTVEQLLTQNFRQLESWKASGLLAAAELALATGTEQRLRAQVHTTFGRDCWLSAFFSVFRAGGEEHLLVLCEDITETVAAAAEHRRLEEQVARTQKMESLGSLAGGVAHDMNNVLGAILGLASIHQTLQPEGSPIQRDMDTIVKACQRGGTLVKGLLGFARKGLAEAEDVDLNAIVRDEVALLSRTTLQRVQLVTELAEGLPPVRGDASALSHALMNLCVNAVDAMEGGGTLSLRTFLAKPGFLGLEVSDTGCGMPKEVQDRALDPFFTTKPQGKGTGLGLPIVYGTMKAHDGHMEIESVPGQGTRVLLFLPATERPKPPTLEVPIVEQPPRGLEVLVVDDDELVRDSVAQLVRALGHHPSVAVSGEDALDRLKAGLYTDLVILDLNMPGLGGAAALPLIRELRPGLPVLLATGRVNQVALDLAQQFQGVSLLPKPFSFAEVKQYLQPVSRR